MREKPNISDHNMLNRLNTAHQISATQLEFLPFGADRHAWAYQVNTNDTNYFLKVRHGQLAPSMVDVPAYLSQNGVPEVVAPLRTETGELAVQMDDYWLILYPLIVGESAWEKTLSDAQMQKWGDIMRRIHDAPIPRQLQNTLPVEQYISKHDELFKRMNRIIKSHSYEGEVASALASEWNTRFNEIEFVYTRHIALGDRIKRQNLQPVICHADIHQANIMLENDSAIRVVDWDEVIIAPKERDLMFFDTSSPSDNPFFVGYNTTDINYVAIAYYRYEWVVQEFAEWAAWILDTPSRPLSEQWHALSEFKKLFSAGDVVDIAHQAFDRA